MSSHKKRKAPFKNQSGYRGVTQTRSKTKKTFSARIQIDHKVNALGAYDTAKQAALAYDRAVIHHRLPSAKLNFPNGIPIHDKDYDELMNPKKKRRLASNNTTGYTGVLRTKCNAGDRFVAQIKSDGKKEYLGTYDTAREAAVAFDRAVIQHKLASTKLNFPNDYMYTTNSGDGSSDKKSASSSSGVGDSGGDSENADKEAVERPPFPQARPYFERDPMLDQLVAEQQNKTKKQQRLL